MDSRSGRRSIAGLAALALASAAGAGAVAARGGKPARFKSGASDAPGRNKVAICHLDDDTGLSSYRLVPSTAAPGHKGHGDAVTGVVNADTCAALNQPPN